MHFKVTVTKEIVLEINENIYDDASIEQVREYWGLKGYDREEVLEFVAEHIAEQYVRGQEIRKVEGILSDENAHKIIQSYKNVAVDIAEIENK